MRLGSFQQLLMLVLLAIGLGSCGSFVSLVSGKLSVKSALLDQKIVYGEPISLHIKVENNTGIDVYLGEYNLFIEDRESNSIVNEVKLVKYSKFSENSDLLRRGSLAEMIVFLPDYEQIDRARLYGGELKISLNKLSHCSTDCLSSTSRIDLNKVKYSEQKEDREALGYLKSQDMEYILRSSIQKKHDLAHKSTSELLAFCRRYRQSDLYYYGIYELLLQVCHQSSLNVNITAIKEEIDFYRNEYLPNHLLSRKVRGEIMQQEFEAIYAVNCLE